MARPLPVMWDAVPVAWTILREDRSSINFHAPVEALACETCGVLDYHLSAVGMRPGGGRLYASRCQHCGADRVLDTATGDAWDLGPEDYGPDGSHEDDVLF